MRALVCIVAFWHARSAREYAYACVCICSSIPFALVYMGFIRVTWMRTGTYQHTQVYVRTHSSNAFGVTNPRCKLLYVKYCYKTILAD